MAPSTKEESRKKASKNYFNPGQQGSRTGLRVPERERDEYGLEDINHLYTPITTSAHRTRRRSNGTSDGSSAMEIEQSSGPSVHQVLTGNRAMRDGKAMLPLPQSRSPAKSTNIRGTPRQSRGASLGAPISSPLRAVPLVASGPRRSTPRLLNFSMNDDISAPDGSPAAPFSHVLAKNRTPRRDIFDFPQSPERIQKLVVPVVDGVIDNDPFEDPEEPTYTSGGINEDDFLPPIGDDMDLNDDGVDEEIAPIAEQTGTPKKRTRHHITEGTSNYEDGTEFVEEEEVDNIPAPKRARRSLEGRTGDTAGDSRPMKGKKRQALAKKDKNAGRPAKSKTVTSSQTTQKNHYRDFELPRPLQRERHQTPMEADDAKRTRFGRTTFKPLQYWKGERVTVDVNRDWTTSVREIVRVDEVTPKKRRKQRRRRHNNLEYDVYEDEDDAEEPWEAEEGVVMGPIRLWDSEQGVQIEDEEAEAQLAFSSKCIVARPLPNNPSFMFAKTLTMRFFGAGVIEIPPGGRKDTKNSRHFQFTFFVHYGRVSVEIAGTRFTISKGGMWQVPRGNFYSITNETESSAKIFFAQGRELESTMQEGADPIELNQAMAGRA